MAHPLSLRRRPLIAALGLASVFSPSITTAAETTLKEVQVLGSAEQTLRQAPGVSIITAEDIQKKPPANDLSEIIRTMPGVNLTGNSSSGQRGNHRQIDLRGMGPENTLIMIDGKPVNSRSAVRYGWRGERDTRGDSNWVSADQVERIEVIRGPAAARYGSGAAGGVVNIITKRADKETSAQLTVYANRPQHAQEGASRRMDFSVSGPLSETFSYRIYGNLAKTDADAPDINAGHQAAGFTGIPAGREGVRNRDVNARFSWNYLAGQSLDLEMGESRQGNIYSGDTQNVGANNVTQQMLGQETNRMTRQNFALTHKGKHDFGNSLAYVQYSETRNARLEEGLVGGLEGMFLADNPVFKTSVLKEWTAHAQADVPLTAGFNQVLTLGMEWSRQTFNDPSANTVSTSYGALPGVAASGRSPEYSAHIASVFVENNIELASGTLLTPGLRFDRHSQSGSNWSPALNVSHALNDEWALKAGIARAYKAPNLYQSNPNYLLYSSGNGCWGTSGRGCYLRGNADLKAETSLNQELGFEFKRGGTQAGLTWFRNDYRDKIQAGLTPVGVSLTNNRDIYQWSNIPRAVVEGFEGNVRFPLGNDLDWSSNLTYIVQSKNRSTGDSLSIIPEFTLNSALDWRASERLSLLFSLTWYGKQAAMKYDYKGRPVTGTSANAVSPYAIASVSGSYRFSKQFSLTAGINNLFDKRLFRAGNAVSAGATSAATGQGAGAATYNEPGRSFFVALTSRF